MKAGRSSLRRRMLFTLLGCFVPMVVVISLLFVRSFLAQRQADIEALRYAAEDIRVTPSTALPTGCTASRTLFLPANG